MWPKVTLKPGRDKSVLNRHPWIFSGAIDSRPDCEDGSLVRVYSADGTLLGAGYFNSRSSISVRMLCFDERDPRQALRLSLERAIELRRELIPAHTTALRLVNGEGDALPGLIVDRYDDVLVVQCGTLGLDKLKSEIVQALVETINPRAIYEKSDLPSRREEGLESSFGWLYGEKVGEVIVKENNLSFWVNIEAGQKTGFFLDQREMRKLIADIAAGKSVLNCFCYTGAFSVYAARGGAHRVDSLDSSGSALETARRNFELNALDWRQHGFEEADVLRVLPQLRRNYDIVILDPPAFAKKRLHVERACRGYLEINRQALRLIAAGGYMLSCSCSYYLAERLFQQILFQAARDSGRFVRIIQKHRRAVDHPVSVFHPEGDYLKSCLLQVE